MRCHVSTFWRRMETLVVWASRLLPFRENRALRAWFRADTVSLLQGLMGVFFGFTSGLGLFGA